MRIRHGLAVVVDGPLTTKEGAQRRFDHMMIVVGVPSTPGPVRG